MLRAMMSSSVPGVVASANASVMISQSNLTTVDSHNSGCQAVHPTPIGVQHVAIYTFLQQLSSGAHRSPVEQRCERSEHHIWCEWHRLAVARKARQKCTCWLQGPLLNILHMAPTCHTPRSPLSPAALFLPLSHSILPIICRL